MSAASTVAPIREGIRVRTANRSEDIETISFRRLIGSMKAIAFEEENATALAMSWGMERKLPRNNLRLLAGTLNQRRDFELRLIEAEIAGAEREAFSGKVARTRILYGADAAKEMYPENDRVLERYRRATMDLAWTPAPNRSAMKRKNSAIGHVWLNAEGPWYDQLRAGIASDEAHLATH